MAVPTAPAAGEPIAEAWGDVVHDAVVAQDMQAGTASVSWSASSVSASVQITFPRPFASAPNVVCAMTHAHYTVSVINISPTTATFQGRRTDGTNQTVSVSAQWFAIGPRA